MKEVENGKTYSIYAKRLEEAKELITLESRIWRRRRVAVTVNKVRINVVF